MKQDISADSLKDYLLKIYRCKVPFDLYVIDKELKTKVGAYIVQTHKIRVYSKGRSISAIKKRPYMNMHTIFMRLNKEVYTDMAVSGRMVKYSGEYTLP